MCTAITIESFFSAVVLGAGAGLGFAITNGILGLLGRARATP
jgi:hypothetical protein